MKEAPKQTLEKAKKALKTMEDKSVKSQINTLKITVNNLIYVIEKLMKDKDHAI